MTLRENNKKQSCCRSSPEVLGELVGNAKKTGQSSPPIQQAPREQQTPTHFPNPRIISTCVRKPAKAPSSSSTHRHMRHRGPESLSFWPARERRYVPRQKIHPRLTCGSGGAPPALARRARCRAARTSPRTRTRSPGGPPASPPTPPPPPPPPRRPHLNLDGIKHARGIRVTIRISTPKIPAAGRTSSRAGRRRHQ